MLLTKGLPLIGLALYIGVSQSFNLEHRLPIYKFGPNDDSYFGYSVAMHIVGEYNWPNNTKWLLVGAPLDKNLQPGTNQSGALWKCPITQNSDDCQQIITDGRRSYESDDIEQLSEPLYREEIKEGQWLGVTVRSQGLGGKVLVCAHRYITKVGENRYGQGLCYVLTNELLFDEVYEPCKGRSVQRQHEDYGFCQVGTSSALLDDNTMVLGSPGPYTWRGTVFVTEIGGEYLERDKNMYYSDHSDSSSPVDKYSYLGMAVTGGRYFGDRMSYAAGAPRANGHGQVVIFNKASTSPIPVKLILEGEQFGSSFGYELCTADINGDQKPDLIAAAPFYFSKNEGGAVYVYQNANDMLPSKPTLKLTGAMESRFGLALANIGDINKDNCEDIAVGAPYEGNGVVYIFLGSRTGLSEKPAQRICADDLGNAVKPLRTFGISIAGNTDLDGNSYPDILVGAYNSSAAVALLARPIINIQTTHRSTELRNIDPNKKGCSMDVSTNLTCFTFDACCSIDPYEQTTSARDLRLKYTIEAETFEHQNKFSRVFFERENKRSNVIKREVNVRTDGRLACERVTGYIKENTRDIQTPVRFRLNYTIVETELSDSALNGLKPILDQTQAHIEFEGTFQKDCGDDDECESDLHLDAELDLDVENKNYALVLGEQEEIRVNVNVTNLADSAYEAQLFIVHQTSVSYIAALKSNNAICSRFNDTVVSCNLGNPMRRGSTVLVAIRFDPSGLALEEKELTFNVFANTTSKLIGARKPVKKLDVRVVKRADLLLGGWTKPEQSFYSGSVMDVNTMDMDSVGTQLVHIYSLYNDGPWRAPKVVLTINWPVKLYSEKTKQDNWLLYLESVPTVENVAQGECTVAPEYVNPQNLTSKNGAASNRFESLLMAPSPMRMRDGRHKSMPSYYNGSGRSGADKSSYMKRTSSWSSLTNQSSQEQTRSNDIVEINSRVRRDMLERIIRPERFMDPRETKGKKQQQIIDLDCSKAKCITIQCEIYNMSAKEEAQVQIKARLWNSTLVSEYPRVDLVRILSTAQARIPLSFGFEQNGTSDSHFVETRAYPELLDQQREVATPLVVYILAVIFGLILLAVFTWILWKVGFFKRKRPDPTLSGNLEKMNEEKPFLSGGKNNGRVF